MTTQTSSDVELKALRRTFGDVVALDSFNLHIEPGELISLLGPSGCGKTTALRMVAGLDQPDSGAVVVNGVNITALPPSKRDMGMVFQAYSLFPNMTARQNVAFGLQVRKRGKSEREKKAQELLELVDLIAQADRYPHQMSGGQQQRVALARALAIEPKVLLLDEPLSALDAKVRTQLRDEIRRVQQEVGITTIFVTHDQEEAMAISDRVGVMNKGNLEQLDAPNVVYSDPATPFVASFVGAMNRLTARVIDTQMVEVLGTPLAISNSMHGQSVGTTVRALVRPEHVVFSDVDSSGHGAIGTIFDRSFRGAMSRIVVTLENGDSVNADLASNQVHDLTPGRRIKIGTSASKALVEN